MKNNFRCRVRPLETLEGRVVPASLYLLDAAGTTGPLAVQRGAAAVADAIPSANGSRSTESPLNPLVYTAAGLTGPFRPGQATAFNLFVDSGAYVPTATSQRSAVMARVSYDFTGDGAFDRVETYNNYATNSTAGYENYTQARGLRSQSGTFADLLNGVVRLELWSAFGTDATLVRAGDPGANPSLLNVPFDLGAAPPPPTTPSLSVDDVSIPEGNAAGSLAFTVRLSAASASAVTVNYATADGSAIAGQDYTATTGTLTIPAGATSATVTVPVAGDAAIEGDEAFTLTLSSPANATLGDAVAVGTLRNDDTPTPPPSSELPTHIVTQHDTVPVFGRLYTSKAVRSGAWSDPATWDRAPTAADAAFIPAGVVVTLAGPADVASVVVSGTLTFASGARLRTATLFGMPGSALITNGVVSGVEIVLRDAAINTATDPLQYGTGVLVYGRFALSGEAKTGYARTTAAAGATTLTLDRVPAGWRVGDTLSLADTRQLVATKTLRQNGPNYDQTEDVVLAAINGHVVTLAAPLRFAHANGPVANLTRSVVLHSENPVGTRGHVMALHHAKVDLRHVAFQHLGRTDAFRPLNNGKKNADGSYTIGTNQIGRYPLHLHHLHETFVASGLSVTDGRKWGIAVHDSHFSTLTDNVIVRVDGAGIMFEDGSETGTLVAGNLITNVRRGYMDTHGGVNRITTDFVDTGMEGGAFWFRGPQNVVRDNLAVASFIGFNYNGYYLPEVMHVPTAPGQHHEDFAEVGVLQLAESRNNEALAVGIGLWITFPQGSVIENSTRTVFENYRISNVYGSGVEMYHTAFVTLKNFTLTADPAVSSLNQGDTAPRIERVGQMNTGIFAGHSAYENGGLIIENATITGFNLGVSLPLNTLLGSKATATITNPVLVTGGTFANYVNIVASTTITERQVAITGVTFASTTVRRIGTLPAAPANVWMRYSTDNTLQAEGVFKRSTLTLNGRQVYYLEQRAAYVIPAASGLRTGTAGKTNAQLWAQLGIAVAGLIAPTDNQENGVIGYIAP